MGTHFRSWLSDTWRLFILYLAVGAAFTPWGVLYAFVTLSELNVPPTPVIIGCLAGGGLTSHFVWKLLAKALLSGIRMDWLVAGTSDFIEIIKIRFGRPEPAALSADTTVHIFDMTRESDLRVSIELLDEIGFPVRSTTVTWLPAV